MIPVAKSTYLAWYLLALFENFLLVYFIRTLLIVLDFKMFQKFSPLLVFLILLHLKSAQGFSLLDATFNLHPQNQKDLEKKFKKYVKETRKNQPLLAVGESHHCTKYYHSLTGPLLTRFSNTHSKNVRLCSEKISQFLDSEVFRQLQEDLFPRVFIVYLKICKL